MKSTNKIFSKSTVLESFEMFVEANPSWATNTTRAYRRNVEILVDFMEKNDIEPILENISYKLCNSLVNELIGNYSPKTIKQIQATIVSMFSHYNKMGTLTDNPFSAVKINDHTNVRHSDHLDLNEFLSMYKAAVKLEEEGVPVLIPIHTALFTGFRNSTLKKLKVKSIRFQEEGVELTLENKNKEGNSEKELTRINFIMHLLKEVQTNPIKKCCFLKK